MKNFRLYIRLLAFLGILLLIITVAQSYLEYQSSRTAILSLFKSQAETMISGIAKAGEKGLIAFQSLQEQYAHRLFAIANSVDMFYQHGYLNSARLEAIANNNEVIELIVFDSKAEPILTYPESTINEIDTVFTNSVLLPFIKGDKRSLMLGFIKGFPGSDKIFAVLYKNYLNGAILVGTDASRLQNQSRAFGAGSIIEDISQNTGVKYTGILNDDLILVATKNFPVDQMDDWYNSNNNMEDMIQTRINLAGDVFEAIGPFYVAGEYYGKIVIGLDTIALSALTSKLKRDVFWHSILSLLITLAVVSGVVIWNNFRLVSIKYVEIKNEVEKLEADKAIKARLASMGELAGGVAHEIRNPLNAIRVIVQRLQREFNPESDKDEYIELTNVVKRETDRINESIEQFLKMARPPILEKSRGNLNDCIEDVLELFQPRAKQQNIQINKNLNRFPDIELDSKLCGQAILNILENALHAVKENGNIIIKTYLRNKRIFVDIEDSGHGIPDELKTRVFDMYFTTKDTGTGMGLPSVLMTVKEHGGSIEILDSPSGGAIFRLEFPVE